MIGNRLTEACDLLIGARVHDLSDNSRCLWQTAIQLDWQAGNMNEICSYLVA